MADLLNEYDQSFKGLGREGDGLIVAQELAFRWNESEGAEFVSGVGIAVHLRNLKGHFSSRAVYLRNSAFSLAQPFTAGNRINNSIPPLQGRSQLTPIIFLACESFQ